MRPAVRVGFSYRKWGAIGVSTWLVRQFRYGLQLPWIWEAPYRQPRPYPMTKMEAEFASQEVDRWIKKGSVRYATKAEERKLRRIEWIYPSFVAETAGRQRLVTDYQSANECLEPRTFRMDQLADLAPELRHGDHLFKADLTDAYYHLRLRVLDSLRLALFVGDRILAPLTLNCGLSVAPWFFTKAMAPIVGFLRKLGQRVYAYLDNFYGSAKPRVPGKPTGAKKTRELGRFMHLSLPELRDNAE